MHRFFLLIVVAALSTGLPGRAGAADYKLLDGTVLTGELIAPSAQGVIVKTPDNKTLPRTPWNKFSQETLKELLKDRKMKVFVELLVEPDPEPEGAVPELVAAKRPPKPDIKWKEVERLARYPQKPGLIASVFSTPIGFLTLLLVFAANLFAGYEVAVFRHRPWKLVCGVSAAAPVIGPIVFLCLPTVKDTKLKPHEIPETAAENTPGPAHGHGHAAAPVEEEPQPAHDPGSETIAPAAPSYTPTQVFKRGEVTFNRRYIETKLAPFFKLIPGEKEKDLQIIFFTTGGDYIGKRINKVTPADVTLVIQKENAFCDVDIAINDIREIHIKHKDAPE